MPPIIQFLGRLHPMVLHAPIGLLIGLVSLEAVAGFTRRPLDPRVRSTLAWLTAIAAAVSAGAGLILSYEPGYDRSALQLHQWLGIGVAAGSILAALLQQARAVGAFHAILALTAAVSIPAGHLGASITHGAGFLMAPFSHETRPANEKPTPAPQTQFARVVLPILQSRCAGCHGSSRQKGGLALHTQEAITAGGDNGAVLLAGEPDRSEMVRRMRLPLADEEHMPPPTKSQPTPQEIKTVEDWIRAGASFDAPADSAPAASPPLPKQHSEATPAHHPAEAAAIAALQQALVHVEPVQEGSDLLLIDFSAVSGKLEAADLDRLLRPVREQVADLTLSRTKAGDALMGTVASMPSLARLNLSATAITDTGLAALAKHPVLAELILTSNHLTDAAAGTLASLPALKRLYVWKSGISGAALAALDGVEIESGAEPANAALEVEADVKFSKSTPGADALKPVNTVCPVSGKPVDPNYAVVYKGRVIGFCCQHCPVDFWADPEKFASKLP